MKDWKKQEPDYDSILKEKPVRIVVGAVVVVVGIFVVGKCLRLLGHAVEDAKYFANAIKKK